MTSDMHDYIFLLCMFVCASVCVCVRACVCIWERTCVHVCFVIIQLSMRYLTIGIQQTARMKIKKYNGDKQFHNTTHISYFTFHK